MSARKSKPKPDNKEQSVRFMEKAEQVQSESALEAFEEALTKIVKKRQVVKVQGQ
jgi:hypothetical protein